MSAFYLLLAEVPQNKAELVSDSAVKAGSFGGTVLRGKGISSSGIADALGLGAKTKDIVLILVEQENKEKIFSAIQEACENEKKDFGYLCALESDTMVKAGVIKGKEGDAMSEGKQTLISVILNRGYADDAMAAARKAGAGGGTIIGARGTAKEGDAKFFGAEIVPEKDMLLILVPAEKSEDVVNAIQALPCFEKAGSGIIFCSNAHNFSLLGK